MPEPEGECELDWVGLHLSESGRAEPQCAGDTVRVPDSTILAYGSSWARGSRRCESRRTGLTCTSAEGRGFVLARGGWRIL